MKVRIKRLDKDLPLPMYETGGSVGFDLLCRESVTIEPQTVALIPANVIIETPPGYMLMVTLRSSTPRKLGLLIPHGVGIIDQDYCGEGDEIQIQIYNFTRPTRYRGAWRKDSSRDLCASGYCGMVRGV